jgi:hypothetical protein
MVKGKNMETKTMSKTLNKRKADMPDARNSGSRAAVLQQTQWVTSCARPSPLKQHNNVLHPSPQTVALVPLKEMIKWEKKRKREMYHCQ